MPRTQPPRKDKNRVPRVKAALPAAPQKDAERVAKVIARAGLGSRREIEDWILAGRVAVNGTVLTGPAVTVTAQDAITVDGQPLPERERTRLFLYHKPKGVVTTNRDPEGRTTLFEILPQGLPRLVSVGRLDLNSEGLLLLTNDGGLARILELPETGWLRRYRVRAKGEIDQAQLDGLIKGITVDGVEYGPIEATLDRAQGANAWITVALREGKNREVRNVLGALGMQVNRLIRVSYGPFQLGEIAEGGIEEVRTRVLRDQLGADIIAASGADLTGPLVEQPIEEAPVRWSRPPTEDEEDSARAPRRGPPRRAAPDRTAPESRPRPRADRRGMEDMAPAHPRARRADAEREVESRGTVADRKGREIKVERVVARPETLPPRKAAGKRTGFGRPAREDDRGPPRRFERDEGREMRPRRREDEGFTPRPRAHAEGPGPEDGRAPRRDWDRPAGDKRPAFGKGPRRFERDTGERDTRPRRHEGEGFTPRPRVRAEDSGREDGRAPRRDWDRPAGDKRPAFGKGPRRFERDTGERDTRPRRHEGEGFTPRPRVRAEDSGREDGRAPRRNWDRPAGTEHAGRFSKPRGEGAERTFARGPKPFADGPSRAGRPGSKPGPRPFRADGAGDGRSGDRPFRAGGPKGTGKGAGFKSGGFKGGGFKGAPKGGSKGGAPRGRPAGPRARG